MKKHHALAALLVALTCSTLAAAPYGDKEEKLGKPASQVETTGTLHKLTKIDGHALKDATGEKVGKIEDLAICCDEGRIAFVLIRHDDLDGKLAAIPLASLEFQTKSKDGDVELQHVMLGHISGGIAAAPTISDDGWKKAVNAGLYQQVEDRFGEPRADSAPSMRGEDLPNERTDRKNTGEKPFRTVRASSTLIGDDVLNEGDDVGDLENLVIDTNDGSIVYAIVASGGILGLGETHRAIPWQKFRIANDEALEVAMTRDMFREGPDHEDSRACEQDYITSVYAAYEVPYPPKSNKTDARSSAMNPQASAATTVLVAMIQEPLDVPKKNDRESMSDTKAGSKSQLDLAKVETVTYDVVLPQDQSKQSQGSATQPATKERENEPMADESRSAEGVKRQYTLRVKNAEGNNATVAVAVSDESKNDARSSSSSTGSKANPNEKSAEKSDEKHAKGNREYTVEVKNGEVASIRCDSEGASKDEAADSECRKVVGFIVGSGLHGQELRASQTYQIDTCDESKSAEKSRRGYGAEKSSEKGVAKSGMKSEMCIGSLALRAREQDRSRGGRMEFDVVESTQDSAKSTGRTEEMSKPSSEKVVGTAVYAEDGLLEELTVLASATSQKREWISIQRSNPITSRGTSSSPRGE